MKDGVRYTLAIEERYAGLAEHSAPLIVECLHRGRFHILMVGPQSEIKGLKDFHRNMGIASDVTYLSFEELDFNDLNVDAMLTCHTNGPGPLFCDMRSPTNIPRIAKTHTLTDKKTTFPAYGRNHHPMAQFNIYFASGPAAFRGSWEEYIKLHPSTLKTVKIFEIGSPRTDVLFGNVYDRTKILKELGLDPARKTVLYAPTFQKEASLEQCGLEIIDIVRAMDVNLLIRVHHMSLALDNPSARRRGHGGKDWRRILQQIDSDNSNVCFVEGDSTPFFVASDLLIGDVSGACCEFMLQDRPVVFIDTPEFFAEHGTGGISYWGRTSGDIVSDLSDLAKVVQLNLDDPTRKEPERLTLINDLVYNPGHAAEVAVDTLIGLITGRIPYPKWGCRLSRLGIAVRQTRARIRRRTARVYQVAMRRR